MLGFAHCSTGLFQVIDLSFDRFQSPEHSRPGQGIKALV